MSLPSLGYDDILCSYYQSYILNHLPSQKIYNLQPLQAVELSSLFRRLGSMNVHSEAEVLYEQTFVGGLGRKWCFN